MAKKAVIISESDYDRIIQDLLSAKRLLGSMRKTEKRDRIDRFLDVVLVKLTDDDDIEQRVRCLERRIDY